MKSKSGIRYLILVLIVIMITAIWIIKNGKNYSSGVAVDTSIKPSYTDSLSENNELENNIFRLEEVEAIDVSKLSEYEFPMILDYGSDSCGPCQQMHPILEEYNKKTQGKAFIKYVDVWENPDAASGYPINLIPTQVFFNSDGTYFQPSEELSKEIEFIQYTDKRTGEVALTTHVGALTAEQFEMILLEMGVNIDE